MPNARPLLSALLALALLATPLANAQTPERRTGERLAPPAAKASAGYREIGWEDLLPKGWDPMAPFKGLDLARLNDRDPRAIEAMEKLQAAWAEAPVEPALRGSKIRIPGFIIPLDRQGDLVSELLLVPYFGACIHTPPPPANPRCSSPMAPARVSSWTGTRRTRGTAPPPSCAAFRPACRRRRRRFC